MSKTYQTNEINQLLDQMNEILDAGTKSIKSWFHEENANVDRDALQDLIEDVRLKLPKAIEDADWVMEQKENILAEAREQAKAIIEKAEEEKNRLVDESEITRQACHEAEEIVAAANKVGLEIRVGAREYADDLLQEMGNQLGQLSEYLKSTMESYTGTIASQSDALLASLKGKEDVIEANRKELNLPQ